MLSEIARILPGRVIFNEPLSNHTTFGIGGPADALVMPGGTGDLKKILEFCRTNRIPVFVFGLGSNLLVRDRGIRGVVVKLGNCLNKIKFDGVCVEAESGVGISDLAYKAAQESLSGLEFAEGIPGTLGGAVVMNAGAYGGEIGDILETVEVLTVDGKMRVYGQNEMTWGYRKSIFQGMEAVVISARIRLTPGTSEEIKQRMAEYARARQSRQPLEMPSAGSIFKRPQGFYVGPMIEQLGLKGFSIGGAQISTKHAGFIVNKGGASAGDVLELIAHVQDLVRKNFDVDLQTEIKIVGEE